MSQNFELLSQFEAEYQHGTVVPRTIAGERKPVSRVLPRNFSQELLGLAQTVFLSEAADTPHNVLFCGIDKENGSSQVCFELGQILAACSHHSVCLVDGDVHTSRLSGLLNGHRLVGESGSDIEGCTQLAQNLWIADPELTDPEHNHVLADAYRLKQRLAELKRLFSFVLIDAPGVNARGDAAVLGQVADATILVIEANSTRRAAALKAKKALEATNARLLGTILNDRTFPIPEGLYHKL